MTNEQQRQPSCSPLSQITAGLAIGRVFAAIVGLFITWLVVIWRNNYVRCPRCGEFFYQVRLAYRWTSLSNGSLTVYSFRSRTTNVEVLLANSSINSRRSAK
jgi:hypothetical protein